MWHLSRLNKAFWLTGLAVACGIGLSLAMAQQRARGQVACRPATPCPCSADGVCRPKRESWGWHKTKWRRWPGEKLSMEPAPATDTEAIEKLEQGLDALERPSAEQEDLRGMPKKEDAKDESDMVEPAFEPAVEPANEPAVEPTNKPVPALEDQSRVAPMPLILPAARDVVMRPNEIQEIPQPLPAISPVEQPTPNQHHDDAPPALPASLQRQAAHNRGVSAPAMLATVPAPRRVAARVSNRVSAGLTPSKGVVPAGWQQPVGIRLINPAAALTPKPTDDQLHQAIYYEATDIMPAGHQQTDAGNPKTSD